MSLGCCDVTEAGHADELEAERERSQLMSILGQIDFTLETVNMSRTVKKYTFVGS